MQPPTTPPTLRPLGSGPLARGALVVAPLLICAGEVLHPARSNDPARQLAIVASHRGAWYLSHLLLFVGVALTIPAIVGITSLLRSRAPRAAAIGGALAATGAVCFAGLLTIGFVVWQMAAPGADRPQMAALFTRLFHAPGFVVPFQAVPLLFAVGMVVLARGLSRTGVCRGWSGWLLGGGAVALSLVGIVPGSAYAITASLVFAAGMIPMSRTLRAMSVPAPVPASAGARLLQGVAR